MTEPSPTRVHLICGFLGVGKTTTLRHVLDRRPADERWAVLVNEFGEIGIDGALLDAGEDGVAVKELPNGCICCTGGLMLRQAALRLLRDHRPHRLFIEPTGLASPATVVDLFRSPGFAATTALGPVITLVDPAHWHSPRHREHDPWLDQIEVADVLLASRADLAPAEQTQTFLREAAALFPPKIHVGTVDHGALDLALLDLPARARPEPVHDLKIIGYRDDDQPGLILDRVAVAAARRPVAHADVVGQGWAFPPELVFDFAALEAWVQAQAPALQVDRLKGVFHTDRGWWAVNATARQIRWEGVQWRRDSRVELLVPRPGPDWAAVEASLRACLVA
ncbi:MAG: GTP-binding protein [Myxococcales bacterium]|nr:GTP-binding protein [Myxococcales bacterium]